MREWFLFTPCSSCSWRKPFHRAGEESEQKPWRGSARKGLARENDASLHQQNLLSRGKISEQGLSCSWGIQDEDKGVSVRVAEERMVVAVLIETVEALVVHTGRQSRRGRIGCIYWAMARVQLLKLPLVKTNCTGSLLLVSHYFCLHTWTVCSTLP